MTVLLIVVTSDYVYQQSGLSPASADSAPLPLLRRQNSPVNNAATPGMSGA